MVNNFCSKESEPNYILKLPNCDHQGEQWNQDMFLRAIRARAEE